MDVLTDLMTVVLAPNAFAVCFLLIQWPKFLRIFKGKQTYIPLSGVTIHFSYRFERIRPAHRLESKESGDVHAMRVTTVSFGVMLLKIVSLNTRLGMRVGPS